MTPKIPVYTANVDDNGLFVTASGDGGDSLANQASFEIALEARSRDNIGIDLSIVEVFISKIAPWKGFASFIGAETLLGAETGIWVRNPDPNQWYSNPQTTSRDQLLPTMLALGLNKEYKKLARTQFNIIKRGFFAQNIYNNGADGVAKGKKLPDTFLGHLHLFIRCWGSFAIPLYPLLFVLDTFLLVSALVNVFGSQNKDPRNCDDRNGINCHIAAIYACPTPISYLARKIYSKYRPPCNASLDIWVEFSGRPVEGNKAMGALVLYFWENNPVIAEAYRPIVEKYFK